MSTLNITPQVKWTNKMRQLGLCIRCGKEQVSKTLCRKCQKKATKYMRKYREAQKKAAAAKKRVLGQ